MFMFRGERLLGRIRRCGGEVGREEKPGNGRRRHGTGPKCDGEEKKREYTVVVQYPSALSV